MPDEAPVTTTLLPRKSTIARSRLPGRASPGRSPFDPVFGVPRGIRTPVTALKGPCPGPLDDGDSAARPGSYAGSGASGKAHDVLFRAHEDPRRARGDRDRGGARLRRARAAVGRPREGGALAHAARRPRRRARGRARAAPRPARAARSGARLDRDPVRRGGSAARAEVERPGAGGDGGRRPSRTAARRSPDGGEEAPGARRGSRARRRAWSAGARSRSAGPRGSLAGRAGKIAGDRSKIGRESSGSAGAA